MKKKKKCDKDQKITISRCLKNVIRLNRIHHLTKKILIVQMTASRRVYNQALYCRRLWFNVIYPVFIKNHIQN